MLRLAVIASLLALVACSGQESGQTGDTGDATPPVSAESNTPALEIDEAIVIEAVAPEVTSCLSLIRQGEFPQAVEVCAAALEMDPGNSDVVTALEQARAETAKQAAADAAGAAAGDAAGGIGDAAGGLTQ